MRSFEAIERTPPDLEAASTATTDVGDDLLRLIFTACHPVLSTEARVALTLRLLGGLTTDEIARAFLVAGADHRPADRPREADARRRSRCRSRSRAAPIAQARLLVGARGDLPRLQRRLLGDGRRRLDAARRCAKTRCGSAAFSPSSRRRSPRCTASWR